MKEITRLIVLCLLLFIACKPVNKSTLFYDSFESYPIGAIPEFPWTKSGHGKVYIDTSRSRSGLKSVCFESGEGFKNRAFIGLYGKETFPVANNRFKGSFYIWIEEVSPDGIHWTFLQSSGKVAEGSFSSEVRYGGQWKKRLMANFETSGKNTDCWQHSKTALPERVWTKIDWQFDGGKNEMKLWLNNLLIEDVSIFEKGEGCVGNDLNGKWVFPIFENILIGWVDYQKRGGNRKLWIDDFVLFPFD